MNPHWLRRAHALVCGALIHLVAASPGNALVATLGTYLRVWPTDSSSRYLAV